MLNKGHNDRKQIKEIHKVIVGAQYMEMPDLIMFMSKEILSALSKTAVHKAAVSQLVVFWLHHTCESHRKVQFLQPIKDLISSSC